MKIRRKRVTTVMTVAVIVAVAVFIAALAAAGVVAIKRIKKFTEDWDKYQN